MGGVEDIDCVDLLNRCRTDGPIHTGNGDDRLLHFPASLFADLLGVKDPRQFHASGETHGGGDNRTGERASAHLIDPGDKTKPLLPGLSFQPEELMRFRQCLLFLNLTQTQ